MSYPDPIATYSDKIWCDVVTMDVSHIILERSWLYDWDITIYRRLNSCSFVHEGKKIILTPLRPNQPIPDTKQTETSSNNKALTLLSPKLKEIAKGITVVALVTRESQDFSCNNTILKEFANIFSEELPYSLPPMLISNTLSIRLQDPLSSTCLTTEWIWRNTPNSNDKLTNCWVRGSSKKVWVRALCRYC